jgi:hypothetical protein
MGIVSGTSLGGCNSYNYITATSISCTLTTAALNAMIGDTSFGLNSGKFKNSVGNLLQSSPRYNYVVRHHRNPRVSYITSTSQTFKPDDTIKIKVDLDSSRYNSVANRYRFDAKAGYTITRNGCQTTNTPSCTIELDYKIPSAGQLTGSGNIRHTLPQQMLTIAPTTGNKPSELLVNHSLTVTVNKLPATHTIIPELTRDFLQGYSTIWHEWTGNIGATIPGLAKYINTTYHLDYVSVVRSYNRFNGRSSLPFIGFTTIQPTGHNDPNNPRFSVVYGGDRQAVVLNNTPSQDQGLIDQGVSSQPQIISIKIMGRTTFIPDPSKISVFYLLLIPKGQDIYSNPPGTIYIGRICVTPIMSVQASDRYCKHLPPEQ